MKKIIIISMLALFALAGMTQKPLRVEIEAKSQADNYKIIPFGKKGVIVFCQSNEYSDKKNNKWYFTLYDTNFKEMWSKEQAVLRNLSFRFFDYTNRYLYLYLENGTMNARGSFQILKVDVDSLAITTYNSSIPVGCVVNGFKVLNGVAMLSGRTLPSGGTNCLQMCFNMTCIPFFTGFTIVRIKPFLFQYDMNYGNSKMITDLFKEQAYVESLAVDTKDSLFVTSIKNHIPRNTNAMYIDKFNTGGSKVSSLKLLTNNPKRKLNTAKVVSLSESDKIIIGTYNNYTSGNMANPAFAGTSESSTGIYFTKVVNDEQKFIKFYNFSKFPGFYSYLSAHRTEKIMKKEKKLEAKGGEMSFNYQLLVHNIIKKDSNYIMIAEAYYPEYHSYTQTSWDSHGVPTTTTITIFDGYRYTNAVVACFDSEGELLWDNSFEIMNILTFNLHERVKVLLDGQDIILTYSYAGNIASKIIRNNEVIEGKQETKIETNYDNDKVLGDYNSDMEYWYGSYFISYGYERIKNKTKDKTKRTVFYFNKMGFQ